MWLTPRMLLSIDSDSNSVTVSFLYGQTMTAAFEDVRAALKRDLSASIIPDSIDILDREILDTFGNISATNEDNAEASKGTP